MIEALDGREIREPIYATDNYNRRILRRDGTPQITGYTTKRVPYDGPAAAQDTLSEESGYADGPRALPPASHAPSAS